MKGTLENPRDGALRHSGPALPGPALLFWVPVPANVSLLPAAWKGGATAGLLAVGKVASRVSALVLGGEIFRRCRAYPYPSGMFGRDGS